MVDYPSFPGGYNTFVKSHEATNHLKIDFSRNVNSFPLNKYMQLLPVKKSTGYYLKLTVEEAGRILNPTTLSDFIWHDGEPRPERVEGQESFQWLEYRTTRYDFGFQLGDKSIDQASWDLLETHSRIKAQQAMTARTQAAINALTTSGNYDSTHVSAVASVSGNTGTWAQSTTQRQDIRRSILSAASIIKKDVLGVTKTGDLILVMGPDTAIAISECQEIIDHVKHSPQALGQIKGDLPGHNAEWNLPDHLYGVQIVVEDTVKTTTNKGATTSKGYVLGSGTAVLVSRPGDLVSPGEGPSFSTAMIFAYEEMTVETLRQVDHRRVSGHVVDDYAVVVTAPATGFLFTSAV
jgi:hypothetical protein